MFKHIVDEDAVLMMGDTDWTPQADLKVFISDSGILTFSFNIEPDDNISWTAGRLLVVPDMDIQDDINLSYHDLKSVGSVMFQSFGANPDFRTIGIAKWILYPSDQFSDDRYAIEMYVQKFGENFGVADLKYITAQKVVGTNDVPWNFNKSFKVFGSIPTLGALLVE